MDRLELCDRLFDVLLRLSGIRESLWGARRDAALADAPEAMGPLESVGDHLDRAIDGLVSARNNLIAPSGLREGEDE